MANDADAQSARQNVVVCVRVRPTTSSSSVKSLWSFDSTQNTLSATQHHPSRARRIPSSSYTSARLAGLASEDTATAAETYDFSFDKLAGPHDGIEEMYAEHISPLVRAAVAGYNSTIFAYGQTGSGKTYTMNGSKGEQGVIAKAVEEVWRCVEEDKERDYHFAVSYLEIYNEGLHDLIAPLLQADQAPAARRLVINEAYGRVRVAGLSEMIVESPQDVLHLLESGQAHRRTAATDWNERSSRSHCVLTITIESHAKAHADKESRFSQLNLIDLAGSERASSDSQRRKEGAFINKSLLTLGTVIAKLSEAAKSGAVQHQHIPYRDSKLTRLLQDSLRGNAQVAVLCTMDAAQEHAAESLNTLKFGRRCKLIQTRARRSFVQREECEFKEAEHENSDDTKAKDAQQGNVVDAEEVLSLRRQLAVSSVMVKELQDELARFERDREREIVDFSIFTAELEEKNRSLTLELKAARRVQAQTAQEVRVVDLSQEEDDDYVEILSVHKITRPANEPSSGTSATRRNGRTRRQPAVS